MRRAFKDVSILDISMNMDVSESFAKQIVRSFDLFPEYNIKQSNFEYEYSIVNGLNGIKLFIGADVYILVYINQDTLNINLCSDIEYIETTRISFIGVKDLARQLNSKIDSL